MTTSAAKRRAMVIQNKARDHGRVVLVQDDTGHVHILTGRAELVGAYDDRAGLDEIAADLKFLADSVRGEPRD
ncbi:hypothetical protein QWY84_11905 [Aquisalimonas lutea]|uniref:hypothetical protein n=1 Tax=Aquisalimonas lutea TaxID=1327750 RepID=UPI0025B3672C|nr:hypothetical protein [Aquisalimonas lutea]MDN3518318.1 hypothetical protein [Aquisalimonas lutea]